MAEILFYNPVDMDKYDRFKKIAKENDIEIIEVGKEHLDYTIGHLLGIEGFSEEKKEVRDDDYDLDFDFTLFNGFENEELFDLLDTLRENEASVQHKAGITENNVKWTLRELLKENDREAKTMGLIYKINQLIEKSEILADKYGEDEKITKLIGEIGDYFNDSSIFEIETAKKYYLTLLDETLRVEKENE